MCEFQVGFLLEIIKAYRPQLSVKGSQIKTDTLFGGYRWNRLDKPIVILLKAQCMSSFEHFTLCILKFTSIALILAQSWLVQPSTYESLLVERK